MTTFQTLEPLPKVSLNSSYRLASWFADGVRKGEMTIDAPYQRGLVWTAEQQMLLIKSWLMGVPIPAMIINDRHRWPGIGVKEPWVSVIDGKQRATTTIAWFSDHLAVPASWWKPERIESTEDTDDGPYVRYSGLSIVGQRKCNNEFLLPVAEGQFGSVEEEAEVYLLVNGGGTPQTGADMANAARIAERKA